MGDKSIIEWTDATWNPTTGCSIISPGCTNCYAMKVANGLERRFDMPKYRGLTKIVNGNAVWTGAIRLDENALLQPLKWKRGRRIFVNSMSDLFHEGFPDEAIDRVFAVMALCPQHTFQILTKRAERMRKYIDGVIDDGRLGLNRFGIAALWTGLSGPHGSLPACPLPNVWLGVSAERQQEADERIPHLLKTPAAVRFVSAEPLLGPIDLRRWIDPACGVLATPPPARLDWIIVGGESGSKARPSHIDWFRAIRDQCAAAGVAYFHKQNGEYLAGSQFTEELKAKDTDPGEYSRFAHMQWIGEAWKEGDEFEEGDCECHYRVGKKAAGRLLDGRTWDEFPRAQAAVEAA